MANINELLKKYEDLKHYIKDLGRVAVAYSSGVDSTFLLYAAVDALGSTDAIAITANSAAFPAREGDEANIFCKERGIKQYVYDFGAMSVPGYAANPADRCYICKKGLFTNIVRLAKEHNIEYVLEGSNVDDDGDYRPGHKAIAELGIVSPLRAVSLTKQEIRNLSEHFGLPTWNKPAYACLATRIPYGEEITEKKLKMIDAGEQCLIDNGFKQMRVRLHGEDIARIELLPEDIDRFMEADMRMSVYEEFKKIGFSYVSLDIRGYKMGNMNSTIM